MDLDTYESLREHAGHEIKCVPYGDGRRPDSIALRCETCNIALISHQRPIRFVVPGIKRTGGDTLYLYPLSIPPEELRDGPHVAISHIAHQDGWTPAATPGGSWVMFFQEEHPLFDIMWALATCPTECLNVAQIVTELANHMDQLDDEALTIVEDGGSFAAEYLGHLQQEVAKIRE